MRKTQILIALFLALCGQGFGEVKEAAAQSEITVNSVPESGVAILFGGLLWFLLLRKRA